MPECGKYDGCKKIWVEILRGSYYYSEEENKGEEKACIRPVFLIWMEH